MYECDKSLSCLIFLGFLAEDDSRCSCPKYNKELIELPDSCTCIQRPSDESNVGSITSNSSNHSAKSKTCVCTQNLCASQGTSSELENKSNEGSGIQSFEQQSQDSELLKTVPDELNPDFASNLSGCSCQSSASSEVSIHSKSPSTISPSKSTTICSCSTTSPFTISSHKSIYSSKSQKPGSKNQSENESRREYESVRGTGSEKLEKEEKTSEKRGEWDEDLVKEPINETSVISQGVDDQIKDPKEKDHRISRDFTDNKCPNNCGCPDCPFLTTYSRPLKFKPLKMDAQECEKQRQNISIYGSDDLTYESNRLKTKKDSPVIRKDLQTSEKNLPINDFSSNERNFSMRNRDFQVQGNLNIQENMTPSHGSHVPVQGRDVLVQGGGFPVQRKDFPIQQKDLPVSGNSRSVNEIEPRNFRNEPAVPLPRMNFSVSEKDLTCSKVLEQIRDVLCENKKETHDISNHPTCPCPRGGFYKPTHTCLPRCKCSCTPGKNSEYLGLTNFIANICEGKRSQNGMRSVTQIGDEYLNKAKDYECDDSLFGINNSMNSFFGFLFTEIKNIKNMLNCGLQKFGANEPADFDAKQVSRPAKCCPSGKGCITKPTMNILPSCYPPPLCHCSPPIITIIGVQPVGSKSLLITWRNDQYYGIVGYEVYIDGCMKSRCFSPMRTSAVAFGVDLSVKHIITVIAIVDQGCSPCNCLPTKGSGFYQPNMLRLNDCCNICA
ncbi:uncharacterized protein LOC119659709 [Hermetia illucens]|uniref:uncharacterized protein LOC119659709 n=1 Tax=Hermetia illucens TaxID=343691 RepID=UPI0018CC571E|nr:uncharacterized protein LOC119659709 [Hermetia illucens]